MVTITYRIITNTDLCFLPSNPVNVVFVVWFTGNTFTVLTPNIYQFKYLWYTPAQKHFTFKVRTCSNARIALSSALEETDAAYEVVIGGHGNTV